MTSRAESRALTPKTTAHGSRAGDGTTLAGEQWVRAMEIVTRSLQARLGAHVDPALIKAEFAAYSAATIRDFIPILVGARVRARLSGSAEQR